jgi:hypothetical protein
MQVEKNIVKKAKRWLKKSTKNSLIDPKILTPKLDASFSVEKSKKLKPKPYKLRIKHRKKTLEFSVDLPAFRYAVCLSAKCRYYKSRHRHYVWATESLIAKPSCPLCFAHNTEYIRPKDLHREKQ